jgi:BlaI family penicillinase repressor
MTDRIPTDTELELLRILWAQGPSTVRAVHERLQEARGEPVAYTTVLKLLQVMHEKGSVLRDTTDRSHVYTPVQGEAAVTGRLVSDLVQRAFAGSASRLVMRALEDRPAPPEELRQIRDLLDRLERGGT